MGERKSFWPWKRRKEKSEPGSDASKQIPATEKSSIPEGGRYEKAPKMFSWIDTHLTGNEQEKKALRAKAYRVEEIQRKLFEMSGKIKYGATKKREATVLPTSQEYWDNVRVSDEERAEAKVLIQEMNEINTELDELRKQVYRTEQEKTKVIQAIEEPRVQSPIGKSLVKYWESGIFETDPEKQSSETLEKLKEYVDYAEKDILLSTYPYIATAQELEQKIAKTNQQEALYDLRKELSILRRKINSEHGKKYDELKYISDVVAEDPKGSWFSSSHQTQADQIKRSLKPALDQIIELDNLLNRIKALLKAKLS